MPAAEGRAVPRLSARLIVAPAAHPVEEYLFRLYAPLLLAASVALAAALRRAPRPGAV